MPAFAIVGCLTDLDSLAQRAEVVVVAKIEALDTVQMTPCKVEPGENHSPDLTVTLPLSIPARCGVIDSFRISIRDRLRGTLPERAWVRIPRGMWSLVQMPCDDRPTVSAMVGRYAVLFLESVDGQLWTLDGPNSIYTSAHMDKALIRKVKKLLRRR